MANKLAKAVGIGAITLATGLGLIGCGEAKEFKPSRIELRVSEEKVWNDASIQYDGMNTNKTFSLSYDSNSAVNFFYPAKPGEIFYGSKKIQVIEVTPEHIILESERQ